MGSELRNSCLAGVDIRVIYHGWVLRKKMCRKQDFSQVKMRHREEMDAEGKWKKTKLFLVLSPRPGPDGPNTSGWYRRLREPISPLSLLNCDSYFLAT